MPAMASSWLTSLLTHMVGGFKFFTEKTYERYKSFVFTLLKAMEEDGSIALFSRGGLALTVGRPSLLETVCFDERFLSSTPMSCLF